MNILVLSWRDPKHPLAGGAEQVVHEHIKGWVANDHKVTFFSSKFSGAKEAEDVDGVHFIRHGSQYLTCHISAFFWYCFGNHNKFDLVIDQFHGWPFFTPLYVRTKKLAIIQEVTREVWFKYHLPYALNYLLGGIGYLLEPLFFIPYKNIKFITGSESAKKELEQFGIKANNISVVPHGVILDIPKNLPKKERIKTIVFLGALAKDKGIEDAIAAFGLLSKKNPDWKFWVIGKSDKSYLGYLKQLAKKKRIDSIKFWGFVSQQEKFKLLAQAHVMLNPSIREGWGLVNIEANSVGTPVIAYNSPGLIDSISDGINGIICHKNTPEQLAKETESLLASSEKYKNLQAGAVAWSKKFNWNKSRQMSLQIISSL